MWRIALLDLFFVVMFLGIITFTVYLLLNNTPSFAGFLRWVRFRDEKVPQNNVTTNEATEKSTGDSARANDSSSGSGSEANKKL